MDLVLAGHRAQRAGHLERAKTFYLQAIASGDAYGYNNLAQILVEEGDLAEGERHFRKGADLGDALAARNLAIFLFEEGRDRDADEAAAQAADLGRPLSTAVIREARAWHQKQRPRPRQPDDRKP